MLNRLFPALAMGCGAILLAAGGETPQHVNLPKLLDPATRRAEVIEMLARQDQSTNYKFKRSDFRLVTCPQRADQPPLQMLLVDFGKLVPTDKRLPRAYETDAMDELFPPADDGLVDKSSPAGPGLERLENRVITVFDFDGREVRVFGGNNMITSGYLADFNGEGIMERLDHVNYGIDDSLALNVQVLELRTVERESKQLLNVLYNWHPRKVDKANDWDYECFDDDKDGLIEIGFGPANRPRRREVVFHWDKASATYIAENLERQPHIRVLANTDLWTQLKGKLFEEIKVAGGQPYPLVAHAEKPELPKNPEDISAAPPPFQFQSLKGSSDEEIARAMGGKPTPDAYHPPDAPETRLPAGFWDMNPKAAAIALVEANRTPAHRKLVRITVDDRNKVSPPASGWVVYNAKSSSCYTDGRSLTVLHFGSAKPCVFQAATSQIGFVGANPLADRAGHALRLIDLSDDEARFLAQTLFWLDRIRSRSGRDDNSMGGRYSTADGSGTLDWYDAKKESRRIEGTIWSDPSLASRWDDEYDQNTCINFANYLLTKMLPEHLGERWDTTPPLAHRNLITPLAERLKPREDSAVCDELAATALTAIERHRTDPWPAPALVAIINCAGDSGLSNTLPVLEELNAKLPPPSDRESGFRELERKHQGQFGIPQDPAARNQWDEYQKLRRQMIYDIPCQLREPLARAIDQLRARFHPAPLIQMANGTGASAAWALQQLQIHYPEAYANVLIAGFRDADAQARRMIFSTLAAAYPPGAKILRGTLTEQQQADLATELGGFELKNEPDLAKSRIPWLLEILRDTPGKRDYAERGPAIELLSVMPLDEPQRAQFAQLLLDELKSPRRNHFNISILAFVIPALVKLPDPDRYWEALVKSSDQAMEFGEFYHFLDVLASLASAKPEPRQAQLSDFIRPCFTRHQGMMNDLFLAALALDLRDLAPEIAHLATTGPEVPDGKGAKAWGGEFNGPGNNRYHLARHVTALWLEPDADTRARMWIAMVLATPHDFSRSSCIAAGLRAKFRAAIAAASPGVREKLMAQARTAAVQVPGLLDGVE